MLKIRISIFHVFSILHGYQCKILHRSHRDSMLPTLDIELILQLHGLTDAWKLAQANVQAAQLGATESDL